MGIFFFSIYQSIVAVLMYCKNHLNAQYIAMHVINAVANVFFLPFVLGFCLLCDYYMSFNDNCQYLFC